MEELYKENAELVYHFLLSKCRNADLAEDLTQETFLQAIKSIGRYNGACKISVWLCQIAKHLLVLAREELLDVLDRLHKLPVNMREVVYLRASVGLSFKEIGRIMGESENWARVNFFRAKELLKKERKGDQV